MRHAFGWCRRRRDEGLDVVLWGVRHRFLQRFCCALQAPISQRSSTCAKAEHSGVQQQRMTMAVPQRWRAVAQQRGQH